MQKVHALVLAAGKGRRMQTDTHKQFLNYRGEALFLKSVRTFLSCGIPVTVVTGEEDIPEVRRLISEAGLTDEGSGLPCPQVIAGGSERYFSSYLGLRHLGEEAPDIVMIHDAARPFVTKEIIESALSGVRQYGSAVTSVPSKDTVKIADPEGFVTDTPDRKTVYIIQTPQAFYYSEILSAYEKLFESGSGLSGITDDASVMERTGRRVHLSEGSYRNIKITTPEDLKFLD